jgi:GAF domain-containing protein
MHTRGGFAKESAVSVSSDLHYDLRFASQTVVEQAVLEFGCDNSVLFSFNPATGAFLAPPHLHGNFYHAQDAFAPPRVAGITAEVMNNGLLLVPDLSTQPEYSSPFAVREGVRAFMAVKIATPQRTHPLSVLFLNYRQSRKTFSVSDETALRRFADRVAAPLHEAWSFIRYRNVIRIGNAINHKLGTVDELFTQVSDQLSDTVNTSHWLGLGVISPGGDTFDLYYKSVNGAGIVRALPLNVAFRQAVAADRLLGPVVDELVTFDIGADLEAQSSIFAPLTLREAALGFLLIQHSSANAYDTEDLHVVEILANHVATALHGIDVFRSLDTLRTVGELVAGDIEVRDVQNRVAEEIRKATQADLVLLYSYHNETQMFEGAPLIVGDLLAPDYPPPTAFVPSDIPTSTVAMDEPQFADEASRLPELVKAPRAGSLFQQREKIVSVAAVPLRVLGEPVGVLFVNFRRPQKFGGVDRRLIRGLGVFSAIAIKNTRLYTDQGLRRANELAIIREIDRQINKSRSLREMLDAIVKGANQVIKADRASLLIVSPDGKWLRVESSVSDIVTPHEIGRTLAVDSPKGISVHAFRLQKTNRANDIPNNPSWKAIFIDTGDSMRSELDVPLIDDKTPIGVMNFESGNPRAFTENHAVFAEIPAGQVVLAVKKAGEFEHTQRRVLELVSLNEFTDAILGELEAGVLLEKTLRHAITATEATAGVIFVARKDVLHPEAIHGISNAGLDLRRGAGVIGRIVKHTKVLIDEPTRGATPEEVAYLRDARHAVIAPLNDGETFRGVLVVTWETQKAFDASRKRVLDMIAQTAAIALQSAERLRKAVEAKERFSALLQLSRTIADESDPITVLRMIIKKAQERTEATRADLAVYEGDEQTLSRSYRCDTGAGGTYADVEVVDYSNKQPRPDEHGIMAVVAKTKKPYKFLGDVQTDPDYRGSPDIHSEIAVPLLKGRKLVGVLNVESTTHGAFTEGHIEDLTLFAADAVSHLEIANSRANERRQLNRFKALRDMGEALGELNENQRLEAFHLVVRRAAEECDCFAVARAYDPAAETFVRVAMAGTGMNEPFLVIHKTDTVYKRVLAAMDAVNFEDLLMDLPDDPVSLSDERIRSLMVAPVQVGGKLLGSIGMSHLQPRHFGKPDVELIQGLAKLLAVTLVRMSSAAHERDLLEQNTQDRILSSMGDAAIHLAHRLNGDLGQVRPYLNFARDAMEAGARDRVEQQFGLIESSVENVLGYAKQLREHVSARSNVPPGNVTLSHIVRDVVGTPRAGYEVVNAVSDESLVVYSRPADVRMILQNLLDNAYEAMNGAGRIEITARRNEALIEIVFADDGPGIAADDRPYIFKFGFSTKVGGTGWGLWKAQATARFNHGDILLLDSERGARFLVKLRMPPSEVPVDK